MLLIMLHQNNLRPIYEKWLQGEQVRWWTKSERLNILVQPVEFRRYIQTRYLVPATMANQPASSTANKSSGREIDDQSLRRPMASRLYQTDSVNAASQPASTLLPGKLERCRPGADVCQELHQLEKCEQFKKMSPEQWVVEVN